MNRRKPFCVNFDEDGRPRELNFDCHELYWRTAGYPEFDIFDLDRLDSSYFDYLDKIEKLSKKTLTNGKK